MLYSRPPHRHPHHSHPSTPSTSPVTGLTQKADPKLPRRRTPPHVVGCAAKKKTRRIAPTVAERDLESSAHERPGSTPTAPIVEFAADPLDSTLPDVSTEVVAESASLATEPHIVTEPEPEPAIVGNEIKIATEPEPAILATEPDIVTGPELAIVSNEIKIATEPQPEPAIVSSEFEVVAELIPPWATVDQTIEQVSELGVDPSSEATEDRWSRLVEEARSVQDASPVTPQEASEGADVGLERSHSRPKSRRLRRAQQDEARSVETHSPELAPAAEAVAEVTIDVVPAATPEVATDVIVPDQTWNETEGQWRRLIAEVATARTIASPAADTELDVIVPSPTPAETTGRWRRLIAEAAQSADVEPAPTEVHVEPVAEATVAPAVIDLRTESQARPSPNVGAVRSPEIERLPRVGSDLREMINTIRRKTNKGVDETGGEPDSLAIGPSPERVAGGRRFRSVRLSTRSFARPTSKTTDRSRT